mgnify:CR=1 FL=1
MKTLSNAICTLALMGIINLPLLSQTATEPGVGDGTEENPYEIATLENLYWLTQNSIHWDKFFIQTQNINAAPSNAWDEGKGLRPIGNLDTVFTGTYDGGGFILDSIFINRSEGRVALFGNVLGAEFRNLGLKDVDISGGIASGGIAGYSRSSTYKKCFVTGKITGNNYTGGIVGGFYGNSLMENCSANVNLTTKGNEGGGVLGRNWGTVRNTYSLGSVNGDTDLKGAFQGSGQSGSFIENCYWDSTFSSNTSGSGTGNDVGLMALTSSEMKNPCIFIAAGWDFINVSANGTEYIWGQNPEQNSGYPFLSWQPFESNVSFQQVELTCPASLTFELPEGINSYSINGTEADATFTPGTCDTLTLSNSHNDGSTLDGETFEAGAHSIIWTLTKSDGSKQECTVYITVNQPTNVNGYVHTVNLYPNPATGYVKISGISGHFTCQIIDYKGSILKELKYATQTIDISNFEKGFYFLRVNSDKGVLIKKLVIE